MKVVTRNLKTGIILCCFFSAFLAGSAQELKDFKSGSTINPLDFSVDHSEQFNGYTNHWQDHYTRWVRYGNLFKTAVPDLDRTILQSKLDIAEDMGMPGLVMQEGFVAELFSSPYKTLNNPALSDLEKELKNGNVLVLTDPGSEAGQELLKITDYDFEWPYFLKSHQFNAEDLKTVSAFYLTNGNNSIFTICSDDPEQLNHLAGIINDTKEILDKYRMHKGWFGAKSLLKSVTCTSGHPLEIIGKGMNEGSSWFVFDGYMDFLAQDELKQWMKDAGLPVIAEVGFSPIYGCRDYEGLQVQDIPTKQVWYDYAKSKGGYVFKPVYDTAWDGYKYDGYVAIPGNKEQIDNENVPFVAESGFLADNLTTSMVLFIEKSKLLTKESMWEAILDRREVAVFENAEMTGPAKFRNSLELLYLDRVMLEGYYGDRLDIEAFTHGNELKVIIGNHHNAPVSGVLDIHLPDGLSLAGDVPDTLNLAAFSEKKFSVKLSYNGSAMNYTNPVAVHFDWNGKRKSTLAMLDLPPAISIHKVLYGSAPQVNYPVSIHNFSDNNSVEVMLDVYSDKDEGQTVLSLSKTIECDPGDYQELQFDLQLPAGKYLVKVNALGASEEGQLGVDKNEGLCSLEEIDLNNDGIMEYRMENDSVQITLLTTGARVIEYIVKSRNDNVLFKIWPVKPIDDNRPFRKRGFYPFGGFEDFLGQASMETHQVYDARIIKKEGEFVSVLMTTDFFGNKLQKTFTLYGNTPLLEVRYALDFINPEANVLGPQPILELGKVHGKEDVFTVITKDGYKEFRMRMEQYYGNVIYPTEGWNAGYDTNEDVTFVGAYPVDQPLFLHMWMNHPVNKDSHHYYAEFQPWTPIIQKNTMYFSYYLWGSGGAWQNGVEELRKRNLISISTK